MQGAQTTRQSANIITCKDYNNFGWIWVDLFLINRMVVSLTGDRNPPDLNSVVVAGVPLWQSPEGSLSESAPPGSDTEAYQHPPLWPAHGGFIMEMAVSRKCKLDLSWQLRVNSDRFYNHSFQQSFSFQHIVGGGHKLQLHSLNSYERKRVRCHLLLIHNTLHAIY